MTAEDKAEIENIDALAVRTPYAALGAAVTLIQRLIAERNQAIAELKERR